MKLVVFLPSVGRGGCEEYGLVMAAAARQAGHDVTACLPLVPSTASVWEAFGARRVACRRWRVGEEAWPEGWGDFDDQVAEGRRQLTRLAPDAVLVALPWPDSCLGMVVAAAEARVPAVVVFQLASEPVELAPTTAAAARRALASQRWVAVSRDNRRHLASTFRVPESVLDLVYNGARVPPRAAPGRTADAVRRRLGLEPDARVVLTVGRLSDAKGHDTLLAAAAALRPEVPGAHYVWAGSGECGDDLRTEVERAGLEDRVHLLGFVRDVDRLYRAADVCAFPTREEGASFALLEAMARARPIVASNASSNPELVRGGRDAVLFATGDVGGLAAALRWALTHPDAMRRMGGSARRRVARRFGAERMTSATLAILEEV